MKTENISNCGGTKSTLKEFASDLIRKYGLPLETHVDLVEIDEEQCWEDAYKDFEGGQLRLGLRAKLFTQLNGDPLKIKIEFIKVRAQELIDSQTRPATDAIRSKLDAVRRIRDSQLEAEKIERKRKDEDPDIQLGLTQEGIDFVLKTRRKCQPDLDRLNDRGYEIVLETILPSEQKWTLRSKTNGMTFQVESISELKELVS